MNEPNECAKWTLITYYFSAICFKILQLLAYLVFTLGTYAKQTRNHHEKVAARQFLPSVPPMECYYTLYIYFYIFRLRRTSLKWILHLLFQSFALMKESFPSFSHMFDAVSVTMSVALSTVWERLGKQTNDSSNMDHVIMLLSIYSVKEIWLLKRLWFRWRPSRCSHSTPLH